MSWHLLLSTFVGGILVGAAGWLWWPTPKQPERTAAELMDVVMWNREPIGGPFALTDQNGVRRTDADFRGKLMLVYFGFTDCPDICPTDLQAIGLAVDQLGAAGDQVQPVFVTLDPERDTPQLLADYVPMFHPRLIGLSGGARAIREAALAYQVLLRQSAEDGWLRLHHRSLGLHLSPEPRGPLPRPFSAWHAARTNGGSNSVAHRLDHRSCPVWVKRYRFDPHREPLNVCFAPKATGLLPRREMKRWATSRRQAMSAPPRHLAQFFRYALHSRQAV